MLWMLMVMVVGCDDGGTETAAGSTVSMREERFTCADFRARDETPETLGDPDVVGVAMPQLEGTLWEVYACFAATDSTPALCRSVDDQYLWPDLIEYREDGYLNVECGAYAETTEILVRWLAVE